VTGPAHSFVFILVYTAVAFANITAEPEKDQLYDPGIALQPETCRVVHPPAGSRCARYILHPTQLSQAQHRIAIDLS